MVKATQSGNFKAVALPEPNTVVARCYSLIDIGTVEEYYNNEPQGKRRKIYLTFEFPNLKAVFNDDKGEEPFVTGLEMAASTNSQSNLFQLIAQWRGTPLTKEEQKSFNINKLVGKPGMISFIHKRKKDYMGQDIDRITNENTVIKFNGIMRLPKEMTCPAMLNPQMIWDWDPVIDGEEKFDPNLFMKIPKWLRKKIMKSDEFAKYGHDPEEAQQTGNDESAAPQAEKAEPMGDDGW
jgi:hypothetical protein